MPRIPDMEPAETEERGRKVLRHPAFGQITVNRISGQRTLYGSDFEHNGFVRVSVFESELERSHHRDWPHHNMKPLIEVDMSEAQWGSFVSSFGIGMGTQCTLNVVGNERKPGLPLPERAKKHFGEGQETVAAVLADLNTLRAKVEAGTAGLSKTRQAELLKDVDWAIRRMNDSLPFVAKSLAEEMEHTVEKAKTEVHAYVTRTVIDAGIAAIRGDGAEGPLLITKSNPAP